MQLMKSGITKHWGSGRLLRLMKLQAYSRSVGDYKLEDVNDDGIIHK